MSKHFSLFQTDAQFDAASATLDYPHVSLIDTTGELKYSSKFVGKDIIDADFGDIIMAEVSTNKLFNIKDSNYNLTEYPLESYKPIAVCIYDKASNANNQAVFMAVQWADNITLGTPKASGRSMHYGFNNVDLSNSVTGIRDTGTNHISSIDINTSMKPLVTQDYSGSSVTDNTGNGWSSAFCSCWRFKTAGTNEGDWYLPSYYDLMKYQQNISTIHNIFKVIKNIAGSSYLNTTDQGSYRLLTSTEYNNQNCKAIYNGNYANESKQASNTCYVRPVFIPRITEV